MTESNDTALLLRAYSQAGRRSWICYDRARRVLWNYARGKESTKSLADQLKVNVETLRLWACAGAVRVALRGMEFTDETQRTWSLWDLRQALSLAHFQVAGRYLHAEEVEPSDLFEWLVICANEGKSAEWLAAQIAPLKPNQFLKRLQRLLETQVPQEWESDRRQAFEDWLGAGRKLQSSLGE